MGEGVRLASGKVVVSKQYNVSRRHIMAHRKRSTSNSHKKEAMLLLLLLLLGGAG